MNTSNILVETFELIIYVAEKKKQSHRELLIILYMLQKKT